MLCYAVLATVANARVAASGFSVDLVERTPESRRGEFTGKNVLLDLVCPVHPGST